MGAHRAGGRQSMGALLPGKQPLSPLPGTKGGLLSRKGFWGGLPPCLPWLGLSKGASVGTWAGARPARVQPAPCRRQLERESTHTCERPSWVSPAQGRKSQAGEVWLLLCHARNTEAGLPQRKSGVGDRRHDGQTYGHQPGLLSPSLFGKRAEGQYWA